MSIKTTIQAYPHLAKTANTDTKQAKILDKAKSLSKNKAIENNKKES